eukprot:790430-Rhodomonas_salina.5
MQLDGETADGERGHGRMEFKRIPHVALVGDFFRVECALVNVGASLPRPFEAGLARAGEVVRACRDSIDRGVEQSARAVRIALRGNTAKQRGVVRAELAR